VRLALAALLVLAGCSGADLCAYPELKSDTCITVHVSGALNAGIKDFDTVQVDVTYTLGSDEKATRLTPMRLSDGGLTNTLPIALGVVYPPLAKPTEFSDRIAVLLLKGGQPVGYGTKTFSFSSGDKVAIGTHGNVSIELAPATATSSDCFNTLKDNSERDIDCGGSDCPLCARGKRCFGPSDCVTGACDFVGSVEQCL